MPTSALPKRDAQRGYARRAEQFAATVHRLRRRANATLQEIAKRSGLSVSTLSKIENGQLSPTYATLLRLADGLQVDVAELFSVESPSNHGFGRRSITRYGRGQVHTTAQYRYEVFCSDLFRKLFTPLVTTVTARSIDEFQKLPGHAGEEFIYVIAGEVELHTEYYEPTRLRQGDGCYFDSTMGHACISVSKIDAVILWIASKAERFSRADAHLGPQPKISQK